ncbi:hypothetical protein DV515_00011124 [Chloebia gouldiae]|uniref:Uncharacterized protein n=1 Tax=Chloebia gouldiae TaxID=44316 RepID=A0A3L8S8M0_CHLGU|nr:hypothetical protein DV515_00011124 [Chloebia gouldiae]
MVFPSSPAPARRAPEARSPRALRGSLGDVWLPGLLLPAPALLPAVGRARHAGGAHRAGALRHG